MASNINLIGHQMKDLVEELEKSISKCEIASDRIWTIENMLLNYPNAAGLLESIKNYKEQKIEKQLELIGFIVYNSVQLIDNLIKLKEDLNETSKRV